MYKNKNHWEKERKNAAVTDIEKEGSKKEEEKQQQKQNWAHVKYAHVHTFG